MVEEKEKETHNRVTIVQTNGFHGYSIILDGYLVPFIEPYPSPLNPGKWNLDLVFPGVIEGSIFTDYTEEDLERVVPLVANAMAVSHGLSGFGLASEVCTGVFNHKTLTFPYQTLNAIPVRE